MKSSILSPILLFTVILIFSIGCKKKHEPNPCMGITKPTGKFVFKELIGDTAFVTDTAFRDNYVQMQALDTYEKVSWTLGSDPRIFTQPDFTLSFITVLGTIPVSFTGNKTPNTICFAGDNGIYASTKNLTMVEQVEKPNVTISPLVGRYRGYFTETPADTFTVRMEYFDSAKYDVSITGSKNFYWFSNMPKGFTGTTTASFVYKELLHGFSVEMGYKSFVFGTGSSIVQGKSWLSNDSIYINYGNDLVGRKKFIGKKL